MNAITTKADPAAMENPGRTRLVLASLALSILLSSLGTSIANVALPTLAQAFAATFSEVQWVVLAYLLAITTLIVAAGRLGDMIGGRRLLLTGIALFTAASLLCGAAPTLGLLAAARAAQGAGAAIMMALALALAGDSVPKSKIGGAMGLLGTMSAAGTALGPSLGGFLIAGFDWRALFWVMALLGALTFALAYRGLPADRQTLQTCRENGFDVVGAVWLATALAAYAMAMTLGRGGFSLFNVGLLLAAVCAGGLFIRVEAKAAAPLIRLSLFRDGPFSAGLAAGGLVAAVMMTTLVAGPFYLTAGLGLDEAATGAVMSIGPMISALSGVPAGRMVDRCGAPAMAVAGLALMTAGAIGLATLPGLFGLAGYIAAIAVLTPGYQLFQAANNTQIMQGAGPERRGTASGLLHLSRNLGLVTGASAMGAVFAYGSAQGGVGAGLKVAFMVAAALIVAALAITLIRSHPRPLGR